MDMGKRAQGKGISLRGGPVGEPGRGLMYRALWEIDEGYVETALEMGIYLHRGPAGEPGRGLIYQGLWEMYAGCSKSGVSLSEGALWGKPGRKAPLLGTPKDILSKALEMGYCFHRGPASGEHGGTHLSYDLWEKRKIYFGKILRWIWYVKKKAL